MNQKNQDGFGAVTLLVIIAIVLIVGGYMYYQNQSPVPTGDVVYPPAPATALPDLAPSAAIPPAPVTQMEDGGTTTPADLQI